MKTLRKLLSLFVSLAVVFSGMTIPVMAAGDTALQAEFFLENADGSGTITSGCTIRGGIRLLNYTADTSDPITGFEASYGYFPVNGEKGATVKFSSDFTEVKAQARSASSLNKDGTETVTPTYLQLIAIRDKDSEPIKYAKNGVVDLFTFEVVYIQDADSSLTKWPTSFRTNAMVDDLYDTGANLILYKASGSQAPVKAKINRDNLNSSKTVDESKCSFVQPSKLSYEVGDENWDFSDGGFKVAYTDGTTEFYALSNSDVKSAGFSTEKAGVKEMNFFHTESGVTLTGTVRVTVTASSASDTVRNVVLTPPTLLEYKQGDTVDLTGGKLTATYGSGKTEEKALSEFFSGDALKLNNAGTKSFEITWKGFTRSFTVVVNAVSTEPRTAVSGTLTPPTKVNYVKGEALDPTGAYWTITYDNGDEVVYKLADVLSKSDYKTFTVAGRVPLTFELLGFKDTIYVNVSIADGSGDKGQMIKLVDWTFTKPDKLTYNLGDTLDLTGGYFSLTYEVTYEDGKTSKYTDKVDFSTVQTKATTLNEAGTREITVGYNDEVKAKFKVKVIDPNSDTDEATITKLAITTLPNKIVYLQGEEFDPTGGVVTLTYSDGKTEEVDLADFFADGKIDTTLNTTGAVSFTVKQDGQSASFAVYVAATEDEMNARFIQIKDADGNAVEGAVVQIKDANGEVVKEAMTDANGKIELPSLNAGTYTYTVTSVPDGYALDGDPASFVIANDGDAVVISLTLNSNDSGDDSNGDDSNGSSSSADETDPVETLRKSLAALDVDKLTTNDLDAVYALLAQYNALSENQRNELTDEETAKILSLAQWYLANTKSKETLTEAETAITNASPDTGIVNGANLTTILIPMVFAIGVFALMLVKKKR